MGLLSLRAAAAARPRQRRPSISSFQTLEERRLLSAISWDGGGDGTSWMDPLNWSADVLPGAQDDVTLSVVAEPFITFASPQPVSIQSLVSDEALMIASGSLTVSGNATISRALSASGWGSAFIADGPAHADDASFYAGAGSLIRLSNLATYNFSASAVIRANGADSHLELPSLSTLTSNAPGSSYLSIEARSGGNVDLSALPQITASTRLKLYSDGPQSLIDLSSLQTLASNPSRKSSIQIVGQGLIQIGGPADPPASGLILAADHTLSISGSWPIAAQSTVIRGNLNLVGTATVELEGSLSITGGASVALDAAGPQIIRSNQVSIDSTGYLDLNKGSLVVRTGDLAQARDALADITPQLRTSRESSPRWSGGPLRCTAATANPDTSLIPLINDKGDGTPILASLSGISLEAADVVMKYGWNGDLNLDGRVNADDYFYIDQGFLQKPPTPTYHDGDFNFDGKINADDYFLIDQAFLNQNGVVLSAPKPALATTASRTPLAHPKRTPLFSTRKLKRKHRTL